MKHDRLKRIFSVLLCLCMMVSCLPTAASAAETACICTTVCTAESIDTDCPVCGVEGADLENCAQCIHTQKPEETTAPAETSEPSETTEPTVPEETVDEAVAAVQSMIDALPDPATEEELTAAYEAAQAAYDAYEALTAEQMEKIDLTRLVSLMDWYNGQVAMLDDTTWDGKTVATDFASGTGTESDPYIISTAGQLIYFRNKVNSGTAYENQYIRLDADLDMNNKSFGAPIGIGGKQFKGTFDGNNHSISNLTISSSENSVGLFGYVTGATLKNLTIKDSSVTTRKSSTNIGALVGSAYGCTIENCHNVDTSVTRNANDTSNVGVGGLVGNAGTMGSGSNARQTSISNCTNSGTISGHRYVGGIVGSTGNVMIKSCSNSGSVTGTDFAAGGILGKENGSGANITGCANTGRISAQYGVGGIIGDSMTAKISCCMNAGTIESTGDPGNQLLYCGAGGICGGASSDKGGLEITNSYNTGTVKSAEKAGGILGKQADPGYASNKITNCHNYGNVSTRGNRGYVGAIVGCGTNTTVTNCYYLTGSAKKANSTTAYGYSTNSTLTINQTGHSEAKTAEEFANGKVYKLLQNGQTEQVWGQTIGTDQYPVFYNGGNIPVIKTKVTITATPETSCTYDGTAKAGYTGAVTATENYDVNKLEYVYTEQGSTEPLSGAPKDAGDYTLTIKVPDSDESYKGSTTINFTIAPKEIGIQWSNTELTYNGEPQVPTATATGLVEGDTCTITVTGGQTNAGTGYTATAESVSNSNYKLPENKTTNFSIAPAAITSVTLGKTSTVYNAENQMPTITAVKAGELTLTESDYTVSYTDGNDQPVTEMKNAGTYKIVVTANNSNFSGSKTVEWKIEKANLTVNKIWQSTTYTYNGKRQYPGVQKSVKYAYTGTNFWTGFAEAASVTWTYSTEQNGTYSEKEPAYTNAGTYTVYYKVSGQNYHEVSGSYNVTIDPAPLTIVGAAVADKTYDGTTTGTVTGVTFNGLVNGEKLTMGADYTATAEIQSANVDQNIPATVTVTLKNTNYSLTENTYNRGAVSISRADRSAPTGVAAVAETISGKADGKITGLTTDNDYYVGLYMEYRKEGETSYTRVPEGHTELTGLHSGKYYIRYAATRNYNASPDAMVEIKAGRKLTITLPTSQTGYTLTAAPTEVAYNGSATLTFTLLDGYSKAGLFGIKATNGNVSPNTNGTFTLSGITEDTTVSVIGVVDSTAPTAEIKAATSSWKEFLNTITFNRFFKETQTVTITANDKGSGVDKKYYYLSESALTLEQVKAIETWTEYTDAFSISAEQKYVVYAKVTDKAGNTTYISSDGLVLDMTAPVISGVENGKTYYTTQKVTANDTYLESLTGAEADGIIPGDVDKVYTITAKDKAGNSTTFTITMKPISSIREGLPTMDTVKLSDKAAIEAVKTAASNVLASQCANANDAEKAKLERIIQDCDDLLKAIQNAEDSIKLIDAMPDAKNTQPDDKAAIDAYEAAKAAYDKLTENEKRMVGEDNKAKLDAMYAALTAYDITKGDGSTWTKGSASGLTFTANGYFGKFTELKVDGETVDAKYYEAQSGSTVITLKASYLQILKTGKHTIQVVYTDGATDGADTFTIKAASTTGGNSTTNGVNSPATGDYSNMVLWISLLCVSAAGRIAVLLVPKKKGRYER